MSTSTRRSPPSIVRLISPFSALHRATVSTALPRPKPDPVTPRSRGGERHRGVRLPEEVKTPSCPQHSRGEGGDVDDWHERWRRDHKLEVIKWRANESLQYPNNVASTNKNELSLGANHVSDMNFNFCVCVFCTLCRLHYCGKCACNTHVHNCFTRKMLCYSIN